MFLTNKLPAVRKKLRMEIDDIRAHNPNIIYVAGTGGGERGPDADKGGYDFLSYWCRGASAMGCTPPDAEGLAVQPAPGYGDSIGGMTIAGGIMGALFHRERTGEAVSVDVSLLGVGLWAMSPAVALSLQTQFPWRPPAGLGGGGRPTRSWAPTSPRMAGSSPSPAFRASTIGREPAEPLVARISSPTSASLPTSCCRPTPVRRGRS